MRRADGASRLACAAVAFAAAATLGAGPAAGGGLDARGTAVGVSEREFRISAYRPVVPPGGVKLNVTNFGEDVHDLVVLSPRGRQVGTTGEIGAGGRAVLRVKLTKPGVYRLLCSQADHASRGMSTRLRVRRAN